MADSPCAQGGGSDIHWGYYPTNTGSTTLQDFSADHPDWVIMLENEAHTAFRAAYTAYGIAVQRATFHTSGLGLARDQEFIAYVLGDNPWPTYGVTVRTTPSSKVYYLGFMEGAQVALGQPQDPVRGTGWVNYSPSYPPQDVPCFVKMLRALGKGIGNAAAHEMGHHLEDVGAAIGNVFPNMDCGASSDNKKNPGVSCENDDNFVYAFYDGDGLPQYGTTSNGAMFFYGIPGGVLGIPSQTAIHWGASDKCWLQNVASSGSCKK